METPSMQDLDDSGSVQDASACENAYRGQSHILDLSDDVLLYILRLLSPRDLKALGYTCPRLGALVCDHMLWQHVDSRDIRMGQQRLKWFLTHCLTKTTTDIRITGFADCNGRCQGVRDSGVLHDDTRIANSTTNADGRYMMDSILDRLWLPHLPRYTSSPQWFSQEERKQPLRLKAEASLSKDGAPSSSKEPSEESSRKETVEGASSDLKGAWTKEDMEVDPSDPESKPDHISCPGPQFTLTAKLLRDLKRTCSQLTSLYLEYCNIDYKSTNISQFPVTLKKLSLRGTRCYNQPINKSYLCKVMDYMPELEYLDVSECDWFEPASLMPLSKVAKLRELHMRKCLRLTECVAYASLATRYGFRELRILDARGTPLADSEVAALGWLPRLEELYVSPPPPDDEKLPAHTHNWHETLPPFQELEQWELEEPEYYKLKSDHSEDEGFNDEPDQANRQDEGSNIEELIEGPWRRRIIVVQPTADREMVIRSNLRPYLPRRRCADAALSNARAKRSRLRRAHPDLKGGAGQPGPSNEIEPVNLSEENSSLNRATNEAGPSNVSDAISNRSENSSSPKGSGQAGPNSSGLNQNNHINENNSILWRRCKEEFGLDAPSKEFERQFKSSTRNPDSGLDNEISPADNSEQENEISGPSSLVTDGPSQSNDVPLKFNQKLDDAGPSGLDRVSNESQPVDYTQSTREDSDEEPSSDGMNENSSATDEPVNMIHITHDHCDAPFVNFYEFPRSYLGNTRGSCSCLNRGPSNVPFTRLGSTIPRDRLIDYNNSPPNEGRPSDSHVTAHVRIARRGDDSPNASLLRGNTERMPGIDNIVREVRTRLNELAPNYAQLSRDGAPTQIINNIEVVRRNVPHIEAEIMPVNIADILPLPIRQINVENLIQHNMQGLQADLNEGMELNRGMEDAARIRDEMPAPQDENLNRPDEAINMEDAGRPINNPISDEIDRGINRPDEAMNLEGTARPIRDEMPAPQDENLSRGINRPDEAMNMEGAERIIRDEMPAPQGENRSRDINKPDEAINMEGAAHIIRDEMPELQDENLNRPDEAINMEDAGLPINNPIGDEIPADQDANLNRSINRPDEAVNMEVTGHPLTDETAESQGETNGAINRPDEAINMERPINNPVKNAQNDIADANLNGANIPDEVMNAEVANRIEDEMPEPEEDVRIEDQDDIEAEMADGPAIGHMRDGRQDRNAVDLRPVRRISVRDVDGGNPNANRREEVDQAFPVIRFRNLIQYQADINRRERLNVHQFLPGPIFPRTQRNRQRYSHRHYLVTDNAILRFGRGDNEQIVHIGRHGIHMGNAAGNRPDRSNLRVLSITGFVSITDRSLTHLATAAPELRRLDFSRTEVTEQGVETFKAMRPDCEVIHSRFSGYTP